MRFKRTSRMIRPTDPVLLQLLEYQRRGEGIADLARYAIGRDDPVEMAEGLGILRAQLIDLYKEMAR